MYPGGVEELAVDRIPTAIRQCERTIEENYKKGDKTMKTMEEIQEGATKIIASIQDSSLWLEGQDPAELIVMGIEHDISMRMGLGDAWDGIPAENKREIRSFWREIAKQVICATIAEAKKS